VIRELDSMKQREGLFRRSTKATTIDCALVFSRLRSDEKVVVLSNSVTLKIKAMAEVRYHHCEPSSLAFSHSDDQCLLSVSAGHWN